MKWSISLLFVMVMVGVITVPAFAQTADHVVINEVDINPPGNDSKNVTEWVELYNPTDSEIDLGGWEIASTSVLKKTMTIPFGTVIKSGQFLTFSYQTVWFTDINETVELRDDTGLVIDATPAMTDLKNDFTSWQRIYDGYDLDSVNDWKYVQSNAGSTNGKLSSEAQSNELVVTLSTSKSSYLFGETAVIQGSVSEKVFVEKPFFKPETIEVTVKGPNYYKQFFLYPDYNLNFKTTINLYQVLGINEGTYDVSLTYGDVTKETSFSVGTEIIVQEEKESGVLTIVTDKPQYIPGETVLITGKTTASVFLEGMKFTVTDPAGNAVESGNLFPTKGMFSTNLFMSTVNPVYGTYTITGNYVGNIVTSTFELSEDVKEDKIISLWTDKEAYGLGDTVKITGRLNGKWIEALDLEIIQTTNKALGVSTHAGGGTGFKILDSVRLEGNSTFEYTFKIPPSDDRLGLYKIHVSKDLGSATKSIHAVKDPENFVKSSDPFTISTDKSSYGLGETATITGFITDPPTRSSFETPTVKLSISNEDGSELEIVGIPKEAKTRERDGIVVAYELTAIPESSGTFNTSVQISPLIFSEGNFVINAVYLDWKSSTSFNVYDPLKLEDGAILKLDKQVYGFGETVTLSGMMPPVGESGVTIILTKPDGSRINSGVAIDNQSFTWTWKTPSAKTIPTLKSAEDRSMTKTNLGIYKITVATDSIRTNIFFKLSEDPENDTFEAPVLSVSTEKPIYKVGEKLNVLGTVQLKEQGSEGLVVPQRVHVKVIDGKFPFDLMAEASLYPNQAGQFQSYFALPPTIYADGEYKVTATYQSKKVESKFSVANEFVLGSDEPVSLITSIDKSEYYPGEIIQLTGKPNKLVYLEDFDISVIKKDKSAVTCGTLYCGVHQGAITTILPNPAGGFSHHIPIKNSISSLGSYEITVDVGFDTASIPYVVVERPAIVEETPIEDVKVVEESPVQTIIEKVNRIPDEQVSIMIQEKSVDGKQTAPRVVSGTLITPDRNEISNVNLRVTSESGVCVIGPEKSCLVKESTRQPGSIFDIVDVDGFSLKVRYSGPDVKVEKFSILPESSGVFLPDEQWKVEVVKDDQTSRLYYKVNYQPIE